MSHDSSRKGHAAVWVTVAVVIPLLYLLSVPPLHIHYRQSGVTNPDPFTASPPPWAERYMEPYVWLCGHGPLRYPLAQYDSLCDSAYYWGLRHTARHR